MSYERANITSMRGYVYGEQPIDPSIVKLNTNENPFPPSPAVAKALEEFDTAVLRRYPEATSVDFRRLAARIHGLSANQILVTNGGDEGLRLAVTTFVDATQAFGMVDPSYSLYPVLADVQGCRTVRVDLNSDWTLPRQLASRLNDQGVRLTCIVNPHAPSGMLTSTDTLSRLANDLEGVLLVDEAYVDFIDPGLDHDTTRLVNGFDNLLILRTLSKGYSLAGLRFGYLIGNEALIAPMAHKTRDSYNVDAIAQTLACAAFADRGYAESNWQQIRTERRRVRDALIDFGFVVPISHANFLLAEAPDDANAAALYNSLKDVGILVRYFDRPPLADSLRISIGTPDENEELLGVIADLL